MPRPAVVSPPARTEFAASDLEQAREFLDQAYGSRLLMTSNRDSTAALAVTHVDCRSFGVSDVTMPADLTFQMVGQDAVIVATVVEGTLQADRGKVTDRYRRGDVFLANFPQARFTVHTHDNRNHGVVLPLDLLASVVGASAGGVPCPLRFTSLRPVSTAAQAQWTDLAGYVDGLLASPGIAAQPLVTSQAARLLAATVLSVFPNTVVTEPTIEDRHDASTATLRRAVAFIERHAHQDITVADIAAAAHVTARTVQLAFRRHLDTTPTGYLRRVRLDYAHRQLQAADPEHHTVTAIALRWGFASHSLFSAYYRAVYGVTPSRTLRS